MKSFNYAACIAALAAGAVAVPMAGQHQARNVHGHLHNVAKRDIVWVTEYEVETVTVVKTVYDDGTEPSGSLSTYTDSALSTSAAVTVTSYDGPVSTPSTTPAQADSTTPAQADSTTPAAPTVSPTTSAYVAPPVSSTTSAYAAPTTSSTTPAYVAPATTEQPSTSATTSDAYQAAAPTTSSGLTGNAYSSSSSSSASSGSFSGISAGPWTGDFTYYAVGTGSCGWTNTESEDVVAVANATMYSAAKNAGTLSNPNNNPLCGKTVTINGKDGNTYQAKVVDTCAGCPSDGDLDMPVALFNRVTNNGDGRVHGMTWSFNF